MTRFTSTDSILSQISAIPKRLSYKLQNLTLATIAIVLIGSCSSPTEPENRAPATPPAPTGPILAVINQPVTYSASATDPDNNLASLTFYWDGTESSVAPVSAGAASATHTYNRLGSFQIFIVANDNSGLHSDSSDGLRINVVEPGPLPPSIPTGADTAYLTEQYSYTSRAIHPDGDSLFLLYDWGDGDSSKTAWDTSGTIFNENHIYYEPGTYVIRITATDDAGRVSSQSLGKTVNAINRAPLKPSAPFGPLTAIVDEIITFRSATADPEGDAFSMTFDFGDGAIWKTALDAGDQQYSAPHQYLDTGMYEIRVSATDIYGNISDTSNITMLHVPIYPSDTIRYTNTGLDKRLVTIQQSWSITWINDDATFHTLVADSTDAVGVPIFPIIPDRLIKIEDNHKVVFDSIGTYTYFCSNHPFDTTEFGKITVH